MQESTIRQKAVETLKLEADAVARLTDRVDDDFEAAAEAILACKGRVVVTGMGKSGHVERSRRHLRVQERPPSSCIRRRRSMGISAW